MIKGVLIVSRNLTYTDRLILDRCYNSGMPKREIALKLGCCLKTVYNELKRGMYQHNVDYALEWRYSADIAQQDYDRKATAKGCPAKLGTRWDFVTYIEAQVIKQKASPAVALRRWQKDNDWTVSVNTLYRYIDSGMYFPHLTNAHLPERPKQKRPYRHVQKAARPPKGTSIERRPETIASRSNFGHWEMDTVIGKSKGKQQAVLVLTERLTRFEIILKMKDKSAHSVVHALAKLERQYDFPNTFKTITVDNGSEFQDCDGMEHNRKGNKRTTVYYCHPYSSYERGSNERMNRMIRRFLPKGQSLANTTQKDCDQIQAWLNNYPRKILDWRTPQELFQAYLTS